MLTLLKLGNGLWLHKRIFPTVAKGHDVYVCNLLLKGSEKIKDNELQIQIE